MIVKILVDSALSMLVCIVLPFVAACGHVEPEKKIEFIYLALGASDVIGVGAVPLTEGYVYLINHDLEARIPERCNDLACNADRKQIFFSVHDERWHRNGTEERAPVVTLSAQTRRDCGAGPTM